MSNVDTTSTAAVRRGRSRLNAHASAMLLSKTTIHRGAVEVLESNTSVALALQSHFSEWKRVKDSSTSGAQVVGDLATMRS